MKRLSLLICLLGITLRVVAARDPADVAKEQQTHTCSYQVDASPSGRLIALSGIGLGEVSPSFRMRLRVMVLHLHPDGDYLIHIWPWMRGGWVVLWAPHDVLVICGHPESRENEDVDQIVSYDFSTYDKAIQREPTDDEKKLARAAFHAKYGRDPKA